MRRSRRDPPPWVREQTKRRTLKGRNRRTRTDALGAKTADGQRRTGTRSLSRPSGLSIDVSVTQGGVRRCRRSALPWAMLFGPFRAECQTRPKYSGSAQKQVPSFAERRAIMRQLFIRRSLQLPAFSIRLVNVLVGFRAANGFEVHRIPFELAGLRGRRRFPAVRLRPACRSSRSCRSSARASCTPGTTRHGVRSIPESSGRAVLKSAYWASGRSWYLP